ncbi:HDOD domain-containing protein [Oscillospiraceae bacterium OttesenSCG-928-G22]|nr:HDOD domain-containing protein [Oscillospiraceae bacterium OttesenSCG-928-G22]
MNVFVARQPIFDLRGQVYAYELLYRSDGEENRFLGTQEDKATSNVIINSIYNIGIQQITNNKRAFINFTNNLLLEEVATLFPNDILTIEVLENVLPTKEIVEKVRTLKRKGYMIVLDDFILTEGYYELIILADIIKIDVLATSLAECETIISKLYRRNLRFLAEKVETQEQYEACKKLGFTLFQGYFFSKPTIISGQSLSPLPANYLRLMRAVNRSDFSFKNVALIIKQDVALTYRLLKLVNSAYFSFRSRIKSVLHALVVLGTVETRKWVSLMAMMGLSEGQSDELPRLSLVRARFLELVGPSFGLQDKDELFLLGLFSLLEVIMSKPFDEIFASMNVPENIERTLIDGNSIYTDVYTLLLAYERGDWDEVTAICETHGVSSNFLYETYLSVLEWCRGILDASS